MISTAVIGARAEPANTAPMPISPYAPAGPTMPGNRCPATSPKAVPSIAPMNSDGANTPPEPPIAIVRLTAASFPTSSTSRNQPW